MKPKLRKYLVRTKICQAEAKCSSQLKLRQYIGASN
jgi:hypothetical protein